MLDNVKIKNEFKSLEKNYPNLRKSKRELDKYYETGSGINVHFIKTNIKDLTDYLLCILPKLKDVILDKDKKVRIDDEEYFITA